MAVDISKQGAKGGDQQYDTSQLRGVREERGIVTGIVKANVHGAHMGVIQVWIPTFSNDPKDKAQWRTVRYCSPFYSRVDNQGVGDTYAGTKVPAGIVTPPPDLGTKVLCFFPEGRNAEGYYFACVPDTFMMQTLPEPTLYNNVAAGEFNDIPQGNKDTKAITNWKAQKRPQDFFTQQAIITQGLDQDKTRGLNNSSYMRESPSEIIGISSKGRRVDVDGLDFTVKYNQQLKDTNTTNKHVLDGLLGPYGRRKGHSIALDDGDVDGNSNQIRLRTSTGHQILMNDTEGVIYVGNAEGTVWIELNNTGTMDVYANDSINFRSKNLNFHADQNIKFHSKGYTQFVSEKQMHVEGKEQLVMTSEGEAGITGQGLHLNSGGSLNATAKGQAFINSGGVMSIAGSLVLLQGPKTPAKSAKSVNVLSKKEVEFDGDAGQFTTAQAPLQTTVDRPTTHEPFADHGKNNTTSPYTGGLQGGGGGLGGAFGVVAPFAGPLAAVAGGAGGLGAVAGALGASGGLAGGLGTVLGSGVLPGGLADSVLGQVAGSTLGGSAGDFFGTAFGGGIGDIAGNFGADFLTGDFTNVLGDVNLGNIGESLGGLDFSAISSDLSKITSNLPLDDIQGAIGSATSQLQNADFGKLVTDATGKITSIQGELGAKLPGLAQEFGPALNKIVPQLNDALPDVLNSPVLKKFPVTDIVKQLDTGFSVGVLDNFDMQGLNAAVVQQVGSLNNPTFVDNITKSVGKYGFNVDQLKTQGLVRPEAIFNDQLADPSVWTGKGGANSLTKFLNNGGLQEQVMQQVVAGDYQKMLNEGAIKITDGPKEVMGMLTASNISNPDIAKAVRQGTQNIEGFLKNTTNIPDGVDVASKVKDAIQTGAAAADRVTKIKNPKPVTTTTFTDARGSTFTTTVDPGRDETTITTPDSTPTITTTTDPDGTVRTVTTSGGGSTTTFNQGGGSTTRTANIVGPYEGPNGGKIKAIDDRVDRINESKFAAMLDGILTPQQRKAYNDEITRLNAQRDILVKEEYKGS